MDTLTGFQHILLEHARRYPAWLAPDVYKLAYQAAFGSGHAVIDLDHARTTLDVEIAALGEGPTEPLLDIISPERDLLRVHLRPLVQQGLDPELLLAAFVQTANTFRGDQGDLRKHLLQAIELADHSLIHIRLHDLIRYLGLMGSANFPPVHHTDQFRQMYQPAYRVTSREYLPQEWLDKYLAL